MLGLLVEVARGEARGPCPVRVLQLFQLQVLVTFGRGRSCRGLLTVRVLPAPSPQASFP